MKETLTREEFILTTGIYVTHSHFDTILIEYEESGLTPEEFCETWLEDNDNFLCTVKLSGAIKIHILDDLLGILDDGTDIKDVAPYLIESLSESVHYWQSKCKELNAKS